MDMDMDGPGVDPLHRPFSSGWNGIMHARESMKNPWSQSNHQSPSYPGSGPWEGANDLVSLPVEPGDASSC